MFAAKAGKTQSSGGGGAVLDSQIVGSGKIGALGDRNIGFISGLFGTCTDGTSNIYSGAMVVGLFYNEQVNSVNFVLNGDHANTGWSTMQTSTGFTFNRSVASYSNDPGISSSWVWFSSNPFPIGQSITCTFT